MLRSHHTEAFNTTTSHHRGAVRRSSIHPVGSLASAKLLYAGAKEKHVPHLIWKEIWPHTDSSTEREVGHVALAKGEKYADDVLPTDDPRSSPAQGPV
jgi:hypothetical protein